MFLSGALDDVPKSVVAPPVIAKSEGPAWGGAKVSKGPSSLRSIQDEQSKTEKKPTKKKELLVDISDTVSGGKLSLSSFLPSSPIPVVSARKGQAPDGETHTPPWVASGTPPSLSRPSIRDIQLQQVYF